MTAQATSSFDSDEYLQRQCAVVDHALEHYLSHYPDASQTLYQAMRYGILPWRQADSSDPDPGRG